MDVDSYLHHCQADAARWAAVPVPIAASLLNITREAVGERIRNKTLEAVTVRGKERSWKLVLVSSLAGSRQEAKEIEGSIDHRIAGLLEDAARLKTTVNYGSLMKEIGMSYSNPQHRREIGAALGRISQESVDDKGRKFMLSTLAVRKNTDFPNDAFFELAIRLGQMEENGKPKDFWENQRDQIFRYYSTGR
jgi:hypothetical protein